MCVTRRTILSTDTFELVLINTSVLRLVVISPDGS